jgi:hypothetical protein
MIVALQEILGIGPEGRDRRVGEAGTSTNGLKSNKRGPQGVYLEGGTPNP